MFDVLVAAATDKKKQTRRKEATLKRKSINKKKKREPLTSNKLCDFPNGRKLFIFFYFFCCVRPTAAGCSPALGARRLMAPLKRCSCQSSTFIRPRHLVIVIPRWGWEGGGGQVSASGSRRHPEVTADWASFQVQGFFPGRGAGEVRQLPRWGRLTCKGAGDL